MIVMSGTLNRKKVSRPSCSGRKGGKSKSGACLIEDLLTISTVHGSYTSMYNPK